MTRKLAPLAILAIVTCPRVALAYCPSYSPGSAYNDYNCAVQAFDGQNPSTAAWNSIFDLVSQGPAAWGNQGPPVTDIGQGCGKPEALHTVPAHFPCELLKGITMQESGWRQFCVPDAPADEVGGNARTIISFDCGYGVGQVTSGMHKGESPGFDRNRVAKEPTYNLATGTQIIADKWISTNCVGDNQPSIIEDWYTATWAYNGLAYVNNPNNPNYDANRGVWDPQVGGGAPYQEKVFGWIEHPGGKWVATKLAYPNRGDVGNGSSPGDLPEPSCASPTDCKSKRQVHATACNGMSSSSSSGAGGGGGGASTSSGGGAGGDGGGGGAGGTIDVGAGAGVGGGTGGTGGLSDSPGNPGCTCRVGAGGDSSAGAGAFVALVLAIAAMSRRRGN